jgi:hypothetical protein
MTSEQLMEYRNLDWAAVAEDEELDDEVQYVDIVALSETGDFQPIDCPSKVQKTTPNVAFTFFYKCLKKVL